MPQLTRARLRTMLAGQHQPPCVSIYLGTNRRYPDNQQDNLRYRNLLHSAEESLHKSYTNHDVREILEPFHALQNDATFWSHQLDGLAVLGGRGVFESFRLPRTVPDRAVVADSFHVKPLLRITQSADRFQILAVTKTSAKMYEGDRYGVEELELPSTFPGVLIKTLEFAGDPNIPPPSGANHGQNDSRMFGRADKEDFFQAVDRAVVDGWSNPGGLPLILACLPQHETEFRRCSNNRFLLPTAILGDPSKLSLDQLRQEAWKVMEPHYTQRLERLTNDFRVASSRNSGSSELAAVAQAAVGSRVGTLLVDADKVVPGRFDPATGDLSPREATDPTADDVLDDLAELVLSRDGEVVVVPSAQMPTPSGVAAMYRF